MRNRVAIPSLGPWHEFHKRRRSPFFTGLFLGGTGIQKGGVPFDSRVRYFGYFDEHIAIPESEIILLSQRVEACLKENPTFLFELMEQAYREHRSSVDRWQTLPVVDDVTKAFQMYVDDLRSFGVYVSLPLFVENYLESFVKNAFQKKFGAESDYWYGVAVNPVKKGSVLEEEMSRLQIATQEDLENHTKKFSWMANTGYFETYYDTTYYQKLRDEEVDATTRLRELQNEREGIETQFNILLEQIKDDAYLEALVRTINEAVYFRSYRTEMYYGSARFVSELLQKVGTGIGLADYKDLVWLYADEIQKLLHEGALADTSLIAERKSSYVFISDYNGSFEVLDGKDGEEVLATYLSLVSTQQSNGLHGQSAFRGVVTGTVAVLKNVTEVGKVKSGDILVTHATNVNFVSALKKAVGVVTEEGGILSHAAIISRELKIPSVIGVRNATDLLKDGDLVEVDAEKGLVKILKRAG